MKKLICLVVASFIVVQTLPLTVVKAENNIMNLTSEVQNESEYKSEYKIQRADVIVIQYRTVNGVMQYRRWNSTQNRWVDSYWINMY